MTDTADHADYVLPATTQLEHLDVHTSYGHTYALINEPAIAPLGEAQAEHADLPRAGRAHGLHRAVFCRQRRGAGAHRLQAPMSSFDALREHGWVKLPLPDAPFAEGGFPTPSGKCVIDSPVLRRARPRAELRIGCQRARAGAALPAGDDLAAGAQLPQLQLRQRQEPARHRRRAAAGDPRRPMRAPRGIATGQRVRVFNDRGSYDCKAVISPRARAGVVNGLGVWWRKLGPDGTNVNELTHQRLTDIGRAPAFYDCLVEVQPCSRRRRRRRGVKRALLMASLGVGRRGGAGGGHAVPDQRLQHGRLLLAVGQRPPEPASTAPSRWTSGWPTRRHAAALKAAPGAHASACATSPSAS